MPGVFACPEIIFVFNALSFSPAHIAGLAGRAYHCPCGRPVFFRNSACLACGTPLGYDPELASLLPMVPGPQPDTWLAWPAENNGVAGTATQAPKTYTRCVNLHTPASCNWLVTVDDMAAGEPSCRACRLNHTIPDMNDAEHPDNGELWGRMELAKRRLVSALLVMGLPVASRVSEDKERGLMFDILRSPVDGPHVLTGHDTGLITLNLVEADDAAREATRKAMHEPYRTLLGHFRHRGWALLLGPSGLGCGLAGRVSGFVWG